MKNLIGTSLAKSNLIRGVASIVIVVISLTVCWLGDDIDYMFKIRTSIWNSSGSIQSIPDFFESQYNHYLNVNGRFVAHSMVQLFCGILGQPLFALFNGVVWFLFLKLTGSVAVGRRFSENPGVTLTIVSVSFLTFITKMMPTTQIGYIWMFTVSLWWLKCYFSDAYTSVSRLLFLTILGIIAGNGQEALSLGICVVLAIEIGKQCIKRNAKKKNKIRHSARLLIPAAGFLIGAAIDCFSPATLQRAGSASGSISFSESLLFAMVALRAFYLMLAVWILRAVSNRKTLLTLLKENASWLAAIIFLLLFNFLIGVKSNRQLFGVELISIIVLIRILPRHTFSKLPLIILTAATIAIYACQIVSAVEVREKFREIEKEYQTSEKGVIYMTRTRVSSHPLTREFKLFEDITGQFDNDIRHSMMKLLIYTNGKGKVLTFRPERVRPDSLTGFVPSGALQECVQQIAPAHYLIVTNREKPNVIVRQFNELTRAVSVDTLRPSRPVSFVNLSGDKKWSFYELSPDKPFVIIDSVCAVE